MRHLVRLGVDGQRALLYQDDRDGLTKLAQVQAICALTGAVGIDISRFREAWGTHATAMHDVPFAGCSTAKHDTGREERRKVVVGDPGGPSFDSQELSDSLHLDLPPEGKPIVMW